MAEHELGEQLDQAIESLLAGTGAAVTGEDEVAALTEIAASLCDLPSEDFKKRLKTLLQRRAAMSTSTAGAAGVRARVRAITPLIIHANASKLVDFLKTTFHAEELKRMEQAYAFYSEVRIGDSVIMLGGGTVAEYGNLPSALHVYVDDCDAAYRRALEAGAVTLMGATGEPADRPYGERSAFVQDAFGNYWYIATRLASTSPGEDLGTVLPYVHPARARAYMDFLKRAFGAQEMAVYEHGGRVMHAAMRVGDAVLELGEPEDRKGIPSNGFFFFVEDVEAAYERTLAAGATTVRPPEDTSYGLRAAIVRDPEGYLWWPARRIG